MISQFNSKRSDGVSYPIFRLKLFITQSLKLKCLFCKHVQSALIVLQPTYPHYWSDTPTPSIYGQTVISGVTFASFGSTLCPVGRNVAITSSGRNAEDADAWHPVILRNIELIAVETDSKLFFVKTDPRWINQGICVFRRIAPPQRWIRRKRGSSSALTGTRFCSAFLIGFS